MKRWRTGLGVAFAALALSGCTLISPNSAPTSISRVPFGLLNRTIPGTNGARVRFVTQPVYFVDTTGHLSPSSRIVPSPVTLTSVVEQLLLGPSRIERAAGYRSALPTKLILVSATIRHQVAYLSLAQPLTSLPKADQVLAVGQLVFSAYDVGATNGLVVKVEGAVQDLLMPSGLRSRVVSVKNFLVLLNG